MLRFAALIAVGLETMLWLHVAGAGVSGTLAFAQGHGGRVAVVATVLYVVLVLPAFALAVCNWRIRLAAVLAGVAGLLAVYVFIKVFPIRVPKQAAMLWLLLGAFIALVAGSIALWRSGPPAGSAPDEATPETWEQVKLRFGIVFGAALGTVLWLTSFVPAIDGARRGPRDGFEVIPIFYATIFYLALVLPALIIVLTGSEERLRTAATMLLVVGGISALILGPALVTMIVDLFGR